MSTAESVNLKLTPSVSGATHGVRLHRFTVQEYDHMREVGVFEGDNPIELLEGYLFIKMDYGPPYDVPLGIPPEVIAGPDVPPYPQRRFTVREYHKLMESGALHPALRTELVEGWVVDKMTRNARHDWMLQVAADALHHHIGPNWRLRSQSAVTLDDGELEPDLAIVPGPLSRFKNSHPRPSDVVLAIEISETTLPYDRGIKRRDYARNGIARYWIINTLEHHVEVFEDPTGPTDVPDYRKTQIYKIGNTIPLMLRDQLVATLAVEELIGPKD